MLSVRLVGFIVLIMPLSVLAQSGPGGVGTTDGSSSLELWLSADKNVSTNSGDVTNWNDRSGNVVDASAGSSTNEPNFLSASNSSITGKPTIEFDGSSDYLDLSATVPTGSSGEITVFIVFKPSSQVNSSTTYQTLLASQSTGSSEGIIALGDYLSGQSTETLTFSKQTTSSPSGHYHDNSISSSFLIHNFDFDGSGIENYYQDNSSASLTSNNGGFSNSSLENLQRIGADASASNHFNGEIAEIIIYSRQLGTEERNLVANYLDAKYQLGGLTSVDIYTQNSTHNYDPAGINSTSQKSTKGGGLDLNDFNSVLSANNDEVFAAHENSQGINTSVTPNRWKRNWKIDFSSNSNNARIQLIFDADDYFGSGSHIPSGAKANDYELLEKISPSGNYSSAQLSNGNKSIDASNDQVIFEPKLKFLTSGNYYTLASTNTSSAPLPVEWQYFKGEDRAQGNVLKWGTASETNARHFQVQRSGSDKEDFRTIATITAAGTTIEPQDYQYVDQVGNQQTYYYRLKQVDLDGSFEYSNIIALEREFNKAESQLNLLKNPIAQGQPIRYEFTNPSNEVLTVRLYDATGQLRDRQRVSAQKGAQILRTGELSSGVYWLQIRSGERSFTKKVVIY